MEYYLIALIVVGAMSVITFLTYLIDKRKAIKGAWRVPEKVLLLMSLLCGGIGGYVAMFVCHHKTRKWYFHVVNILGIVISIALVVALFVVGGTI